jgi:YidC/Oxa1 family membrane protein insertase
VDNRNLIIAVALAGLVVLGFGVLFPLLTGRGKGKDGTAPDEPAAGASAEEPGEPEPGEEGLTEEAWDLEEEEEDLLEGPGPEAAEPVALETALIRATLGVRGASIRSLELRAPRYVREAGKDRVVPIDVVSRSAAGDILPLLSFEAGSKGGSIEAGQLYEVEERQGSKAVFVARRGPWQVRRTYRALDEPYQIEAVTVLRNAGTRKLLVRPVLTVSKFLKQSRGGGLLAMFRPQLNIVKGMCMLEGDIERRDVRKIDKKGGIDRLGHVDYLAVDDLYFLSALVPEWEKLGKGGPEGEGRELRCSVGPDGHGGLVGKLDFGKREVAPGETLVLPVRAYLGPKEYEILHAAGGGLGKAIDYGWFGSLSRFLYVVLTTFHGWVHNWALAIIMLTILVKLVLSPLTHWSFKSMQKMQAIKPLIDDINARYPETEDRDKKSQALMALYRTHKINPLMGCLPMMLQFPIWIALYRMLANSVELYRTPLILWIHDLSQPDPYFVLPLVLGASMFLQQKLTPTTADNQQAKIMMYMMPVMFTVFMLFLPAGLNLYILVNTLLTITQQRLLYRPRVVTAVESKVQLMSDMEPGEIEDKRRARKEKNPPAGRRGGKGRKKR